MKKILILLLLLSGASFAQSKYFIYFKDKGIKKDSSLSKTATAYVDALKTLSPASIERRKKVLGEDYIEYDDIPINKDYINAIEMQGIKIINKLSWFNSVSAYLTKDQSNSISALPFVKEVRPVRVLKFRNEDILSAGKLDKSLFSISDYGLSYSQLALSDIPVVHSKGITGQGVLIGLLDTGFDWKRHESLKNKHVVGEYDFINHDSVTANQPGDPPGQDGHGTLVFSVLGGFKDSVLIGSSFNSSFILAKTENIASESHIEEDNYAAALIWMENMGVQVTTSSLGYNIFDDTTYSYTYQDMNGKTTIVALAVKAAFHKGVVTFTAAGNEGDTPWFYVDTPADEDSIISVGAVDGQNVIAPFSSRGPTSDGRIKPEVVARGTSVFGAASGTVSNYITASGTSLSAPIACGIAGLLLSAYPFLTNRQVRDIILESSDNASSPNNVKGYGLISAKNAISFPNIHFESSANSYVLNKIFFVNGINPLSVKIIYTGINGNSITTSMIYDKSLKYTFSLPSFPDIEGVNFYFSYNDSSGHNFREPSSDSLYYKYISGTVNVALNLPLKPAYNYGILSQNYPNPFNYNTTIKFKSAGNQRAELYIFNILGEKVRTIHIPITLIGENQKIWDGTSNSGAHLPSGVYVYVLNLDGNYYSKKMVYLK